MRLTRHHKADGVDGEEREEAQDDLVSGPPQKPWYNLSTSKAVVVQLSRNPALVGAVGSTVMILQNPSCDRLGSTGKLEILDS